VIYVSNEVVKEQTPRKFEPRNNRFTPRPRSEHRPRPQHSGLPAMTVRVDYRGDSKEERDQALDKALNQLKKMMIREGITQELKDRQYFTSDGRKEYLKRRSRIYSLKNKKKKDFKKFRKRHDR
jgi:ribosomal protein S21